MNASKKLYNSFASNYRNYSSLRKKYLETIDQIICDYIKKNTEFKKISICDLGAGDGIRGYQLSKKLKAAELTLIDESEEMYKLCRKIIKAKSINQSFSQKSIDIQPSSISVALSLWNVFGHIKNPQKRLIGLKAIEKILVKNGVVFIDINNRYNINAYGLKNVTRNIIKDIFVKSPENGNVNFSIKIGDSVKIPAHVYIFNPWELDKLIKKANLSIKEKLFIDYETGKISSNPFLGQILYVLSK